MSKVFIGIQAEEKLRDEIRRVAKEQGLTMSGYIKHTMIESIKQHEANK